MIDNKYTKLTDLFEVSKCIKLFDGLSTNSSIMGPYVSNTASNERYSTNYAGSFAFLDDFLRKIKKSLESIPNDRNDILDVEIGYQFPTNDDVKMYIEGIAENDQSKAALKNKVININKPSLDIFINNLINKIKSPQKVTYIAGKVGSGKSTFIDMISNVYKDTFEKSKTIIVRLNHEDFLITNFIHATNSIEEIKHHIEKILYSKIIKGLVKSSQIEIPDPVKIRFISTYNVNFDYIWDQTDETLCNCAPSFLRYISQQPNNQPNLLVIIDGFDILNPAETKCYKNFVNVLTSFMDSNFHINMHFLLTLRNCTLPLYRIGQLESFTIVPPNEKLIYHRAIKHFIKLGNDGINKPFWDNAETNIIKTFDIILNQISINLNCSKHHKTVIQLFDYDYRILLDYVHHILCYIISEKTKNTDLPEENVENFIRNRFYNLKDLKFFLHKKHYIVSDILLLKNNSTYDNLFKYDELKNSLECSERRSHSESNKELSCLVNNVYNYCTYKTKFGTVFPLLIKIRILQLLNYYKKYTLKKDIISFLKILGYDIEQIDLLLDDLLFSRLIKVHYNTPNCEYNITNKGLYVIDDFCITPTYTNHIISLSVLPSSVIDKNFIKQYSPANQNHIVSIQIGIKNSFVFLNLIRNIEECEKLFLSKIDQSNQAEYKNLFISSKMEYHFILALTKIIPRWNIIDPNFDTKYDAIIQNIQNIINEHKC